MVEKHIAESIPRVCTGKPQKGSVITIDTCAPDHSRSGFAIKRRGLLAPVTNFHLTTPGYGPNLSAEAHSMDTLMMTKLRVNQMGHRRKALTAVAAYEDSSTDTRVCEFCENLTRHLGPAREVKRQMWLLSELRIPQLSAIAAGEAAQADLVLISVHSCEEPPAELKSWIEQWLARKGERSTLLLGLFDAVYLGVSAPLRKYLQQVAQRGHMEFLAQSEDGLSPS